MQHVLDQRSGTLINMQAAMQKVIANTIKIHTGLSGLHLASSNIHTYWKLIKMNRPL
jgi:hypothetical protein